MLQRTSNHEEEIVKLSRPELLPLGVVEIQKPELEVPLFVIVVPLMSNPISVGLGVLSDGLNLTLR